MVEAKIYYEVTVHRDNPVKRKPWSLSFEDKEDAFWYARVIAKAFPNADLLLGDLQEAAMPDSVDHIEAASGHGRITLDRKKIGVLI